MALLMDGCAYVFDVRAESGLASCRAGLFEREQKKMLFGTRGILLLSTVLVFLVEPSYLTSAEAKKSIPGRLEAAASALQERRYPDAVRQYEWLVEALPDEAGIRSNLGIAYYLSGNYAQAITVFRDALSTNSDLLAANLFLGVSYLKLNEADEAIPFLDKALRLAPENSEARLALGTAYLSQRRYLEAINEFDEAVETRPENLEIRYQLGKAYLKLGDDATNQLHELDPDKSSVWARLLSAEVSLGRGHFTYPETDLKKLAAEFPSLPSVHSRLNELYLGRKEYDLARDELRKEQRLLSRCPEQVRDLELRSHRTSAVATFAAGCYFHRDDFAKSFATVHAILRREPHNLEALFWQAKASKELAISAFRKVAALDPDSFRTHQLQGQIYTAEYRLEEGVREYRKAIRLRPNLSSLHLELGMLYRSHETYELAIVEVQNAVDLSTNDPEANYVLGDVYVKAGFPADAVPFLKKALVKDPNYLEARLALGKAYRAEGRIDDAIREMRAALPIDRAGEIHYQLAGLYRRIGRFQQAQEELATFQRLRKARMAAAHEKGVYGLH